MNKYKSESRKARKANARLHACERKVAYDTAEAAYQKGQESYRCKYCGKWHRSGSFSKLLSKVKKIADKQQ